ncbi:MAG: ABC transporter permease [Coriobacteriales bacterium]|nr:ABC transporter permease [Coriobacteriales bacterium]
MTQQTDAKLTSVNAVKDANDVSTETAAILGATGAADRLGSEYDEELLRKERKANSAWSKLRRNKTAMVGLVIVVIMVSLAVFAPFLTTYDYKAIDPIASYLPPRIPVIEDLGIFDGTEIKKGPEGTSTVVNPYVQKNRTDEYHIFGTDKIGRDLFSRMLYGARISLIVAFGGTIVAGAIGVILGLIAGYFGGAVDSVIMRIMDGMLSFPFILLAIILMTVLGSGLFNVILAIGIGNVPNFARVVRGEVYIVKSQEYCNAARIIGVSNIRMLFTHILPNAISPLIVYATLGIAGAIISEAALSFLGLGITEPTPSWGQILYSGKDVMNGHPYIATISGLFILITVLGFNLLGDGIRDVLDPKMKK